MECFIDGHKIKTEGVNYNFVEERLVEETSIHEHFFVIKRIGTGKSMVIGHWTTRDMKKDAYLRVRESVMTTISHASSWMLREGSGFATEEQRPVKIDQFILENSHGQIIEKSDPDEHPAVRLLKREANSKIAEGLIYDLDEFLKDQVKNHDKSPGHMLAFKQVRQVLDILNLAMAEIEHKEKKNGK